MNNHEIYPQYPYPPEVQQGGYPHDERMYEYVNNVEQYGSIIKDLTDTETLLDNFELRLLGKKRNPDGKVVDDDAREVLIHKKRVAREFVDILKSVVNRHNDFSYYSEKEGYAIINGANYTINRWLMLQAEDVPLRYRSKISFEAMSLISASIHKAIDGRMLRWTKGTFTEGRNINERPQERRSMMDYIFPWTKKAR